MTFRCKRQETLKLNEIALKPSLPFIEDSQYAISNNAVSPKTIPNHNTITDEIANGTVENDTLSHANKLPSKINVASLTQKKHVI